MDNKCRAQAREEVKAGPPQRADQSVPRPLPWGHDPGAYHVALFYNYTISHTGILRFIFDDHHNVKGFAHFFQKRSKENTYKILFSIIIESKVGSHPDLMHYPGRNPA